jgi:AAA domain
MSRMPSPKRKLNHACEQRMRFLDVEVMRKTPPPPVAWLIEGLAARGALTLLAGQPKAGKSLLALALAGGVAAGEPLGGVACRRAKALAIDAENGADEIHRRIWALGLPAPAARQLHVLEARGLDLRAELPSLERLIASRAPNLVVLDSFRSLWSGSERADAEVEALLSELRALAKRRKLALMLLHHTTKGGSPYRGSNAIAAGVDLAATLTAPVHEPDRTVRVLEVFASRLGPRTAPMPLRLLSADGRVRIDRAAPMRASRGLRADIIATATKAGDWIEQAELARLLGRAPSQGSLRNTLAALEAEGKLEHRSLGRCREWRLTLPYARQLMSEQGR